MLGNQIQVARTTNSIIKSIRCSTWIPFFIRENMSEHLTLSAAENKLNELNKKIVEIKKKIQLSGNGSNHTKHPSLIYTVPDNLPSQCCKTTLRQSCRVRSCAYTGCAASIALLYKESDRNFFVKSLKSIFFIFLITRRFPKYLRFQFN